MAFSLIVTMASAETDGVTVAGRAGGGRDAASPAGDHLGHAASNLWHAVAALLEDSRVTLEHWGAWGCTLESAGGPWSDQTDQMAAWAKRAQEEQPDLIPERWLVTQQLLQRLATIQAWPPDVRPWLGARRAAVMRALRRTGAPPRGKRPPPKPPDADVQPPREGSEDGPHACRGPDLHHRRQWREAALRRHRTIVRDLGLSAGDGRAAHAHAAQHRDQRCGNRAGQDAGQRGDGASQGDLDAAQGEQGGPARPAPPREEPGLEGGDAASHTFAPWADHASRAPGDHDVVESINVTDLHSAFPHLVMRGAVTAIQEHSQPAHTLGGWARKATGCGYQLILGPPDPEARGAARGGVGFIAPRAAHMVEMPPVSAAFARARSRGRAIRVVARLVNGTAVTVYNVYGVANGHQDKHAAAATDGLIRAVREEILQQGDVFVALVGDFNAEPEDLPALQHLTQEAGWTDAALHPGWSGGTPPQATCFAPNSVRGNRRDFIFVDPHLVQAARGFRVTSELTFPVHRPLQLTLDTRGCSCAVFRARMPPDPLGLRPSAAPEQGEGDTMELADVDFSGHIDAAIRGAEGELAAAASAGDTTRLWRTWSQAVEEGFLAGADSAKVQAAGGLGKLRGRGRTRIRMETVRPPRVGGPTGRTRPIL